MAVLSPATEILRQLVGPSAACDALADERVRASMRLDLRRNSYWPLDRIPVAIHGRADSILLAFRESTGVGTGFGRIDRLAGFVHLGTRDIQAVRFVSDHVVAEFDGTQVTLLHVVTNARSRAILAVPDSGEYVTDATLQGDVLWIVTRTPGAGYRLWVGGASGGAVQNVEPLSGPTRLYGLADGLALVRLRAPFTIEWRGPATASLVDLTAQLPASMPGTVAAVSLVQLGCGFAILTLADLRSPRRWIVTLDQRHARATHVAEIAEPLAFFGADAEAKVLYAVSDAPGRRGVSGWQWVWRSESSPH